MAQLHTTFHPDDAPADEFERLPIGSYYAQIVESTILPTKKGGEFLKLTFEVLSGPYERRRWWEQINIINDNETAMKIGAQTLAKICRAVGSGPITDSEELHFKPLMLVVGERTNKQTGEIERVAKGFDAVGALPPATPAAHAVTRPAPTAPATRQAAPAAGAKARPWGKGAAAPAADAADDGPLPF